MQEVKTIKRDFNLIRQIMLQIDKSITPGQHFHLPPYPEHDFTVNLHVHFLKEEGMIKAHCDKDQFGQVPVTWINDILASGHDFLALIRDENNWNFVMDDFKSSNQEPTFETLIYALKHIKETKYLKEQRDLVAKQYEYTATIKGATISTKIATWVMAFAIVTQVLISLFPYIFPNKSMQEQPAIKAELVPPTKEKQDTICTKGKAVVLHGQTDSNHIHVHQNITPK